jgi:hypothetical protein
MRRFLGAGVVLGLFVVAGAAQDGPVTIKIRKGEVGDIVKQTKNDSFGMKLSITMAGQTQDKTEARTIKMTFTDEVLEKAAGSKKPTKTKRTIISAEATEDGKPKDIGLAGKNIIIEKKDKKTTYTFDDGTKLSEDQLKFLDANQKDDGKDKPDFDELMVPKDPVKVGESWKINTADLAKGFDDNFEIDAAKSKATGTLTKVYDKDGRKYGVLDIKLDLAVSKLGEGAMAIPLKDGSKMQVEGSLDVCIDGTAEAGSMTMTMKGDFEGEIMGVVLKLTMTGKNSSTAEPARK